MPICSWGLGNALLPGKLDSTCTGPYLIVATLGWTVGIQRHPDEPVIFIHCKDVKKIPQPSGVQSWHMIPPPGGTPAVPMLGASTVAHTSRDSPSVTALPPDEGVELADVDYVRNERSMSQHSESKHTSMPSEGGQRSLRTDSVVSERCAGGHDLIAPAMAESCIQHPTTPGIGCRTPPPRCPETSGQGVPFHYNGPGFCGVCDTRIYSALDAHMVAYHLKLGQLWRCPVTWCAV